ncbi:hypothetical protein L2D08_07580 [Domibacillus sp. PGB-M46]|uniref:hypothetical protein n=1 Tax=Domibacillus sp. PGB-M46 TaxID=2910255 RepID=UPI001F5632D6|nr:hypothetical protein [Domibacillus sp. PGB-M46]MCI2254221.1 hypothetical protein [Domibacillus sp. PGB-M46]
MSVNPLVLAETGKIVNELIVTYGKYKEIQEKEQTERIRIRATLLALTKKIEAETQSFTFYLGKRFEERHRIYDIAEEMMQYGMREKDSDMIHAATALIKSTYSQDPLNGNPLLKIEDIN